MFVRIKDEQGNIQHKIHKNMMFTHNKTFLQKEFCENSEIAIKLYFNETYVNSNRQSKDLQTHYIKCTTSLITNNKNIFLVTGISGGILLVFLIVLVVVIVLKKRCCKMRKRNVDDMDVDLSPVYGDYYYQDGERRQNVVEVNINAVF